jgi:hypothetical protein
VNFTEQVTLTKSGGVFAVGIAGFSRFVGFTADNDSALVYNASNGLRIATVANVSMGGFSERARFDSNGNFVLGTTTASARLHVRGDGTNPILRTEDNSGNAVGVIAYNTRLDIYGRNFSSNEYLVNIYNGLSWGATSGTVGFLNFSNTSFSAGAGSANFRPLNIAYTINNSGAQTGTATGIFLDATETALNGMAHNLMDLQVGGVGRTGGAVANSFTGTTYFSLLSEQRLVLGTAPNRTILISTGDSILTLLNGAENNFNRVNLGGTTNAFPAIKRNNAAIDFVNAADTGFCNISAAGLTLSGNIGLNSGAAIYSGTQLRIGAAAISILSDSGADINFTAGASGRGWGVSTATSSGVGASAFLYVGGTATGVTMGSNANAHASALLDMVSTTKGFLPPRMTDTEVRTIPSPAEGLVVFNTDISHFCVYQGGNWVRMSHSPM